MTPAEGALFVKTKSSLRKKLADNWIALIPYVMLILIIVIMGCLNSNTFSARYFANKCDSAFTLVLVAIGQTFVLLTGGFDLSVGGIICITNCITVGDHKCIITNKIFNTLNASASLCIQSSINNCYLPWLSMLIVNYHFITFCEIKSNIGCMNKIICKPFFNYMLLVPSTNNKFINAIR